MDVLERDGETGSERRGQETKDGGIAEGDLEVKGRMEGKRERGEMTRGGRITEETRGQRAEKRNDGES